MKTKTTTWKPSVGTFSKALPGAISLNFAESGGANCSNQCQALQRGICYAIHTERMKPSIAVSGERKRETGFAACCDQYRADIERKVSKGEIIPWIRFSSFGSVPNRPLNQEEIIAFVKLVRSFPAGVPVHFPVESPEKAERFRMLAVAFDLPLVVRESIQSKARLDRVIASGSPSSVIVEEGETKRDRLANAISLAKTIPGAKVCPAIASTVNSRPVKIKCGVGKGGCTACSRADVSLVLYPQH